MYAGRLVEIGPVAEVIAAPRHPYTRLLIDSLPGIQTQEGAARHSGPAAAARPTSPGCSFNPRCPYAFERCRGETPELHGSARQRRGLPSLSGARTPAGDSASGAEPAT